MEKCVEGCPTEKQKRRFGYHIGLELYRNFKPNHEYFLGPGSSQSRFVETKLDYGILPYQRVVKFHWVQLQLGLRYTFSTKRKNNFFIENGIMAGLKCNYKSN